ncbi:hypothetical protein DPMN_107377 [Dreissena polymorpha]|uniref:Uncharacterized protein n=1 Tax=Dreissena polymorpha TaxID=45954 RepID=A0A9D4QK34_DREPO|nr:hypothetical protein DPMN_107377 [Dreissena polymorpha]
MTRNKDIVGLRKEVLLETSRSRFTSESLDMWYSSFRDFLAEKGFLDQPERIWNQMGSRAGYVIGPSREKSQTQVPLHMSESSTKARLTVMFSASASGSMMPPVYVYPDPPPKGLYPLNWICGLYRMGMDELKCIHAIPLAFFYTYCYTKKQLFCSLIQLAHTSIASYSLRHGPRGSNCIG